MTYFTNACLTNIANYSGIVKTLRAILHPKVPKWKQEAERLTQLSDTL